MCGLAKRCGARLLLASTSEVYGDPLEHPQTEGYFGNVHCGGPRSCYDEGKRAAEVLCTDYHRQHNLDIRIARIFNTYGPRMAFDDGRVVSNFISQSLQGSKLSIYGDGSQTRSFCYVSDLVDGLVRLMEAPSFTGPVNLGNPREFTILQLAEKVSTTATCEISTELHPLPCDDPQRRQPDISKAKRELGWEPTVGLEAGLELTFADFRARGM